jgi:tetratricopeptide (TPR) repeat protein
MGRKRRTKPSKRQSSNALRRNGLEAFKKGHYSKAIKSWQRAGQQVPDLLPTSALAEAHFRRGLNAFYEASDHQAGLEDLEQAIELEPEELRFRYHLGLALHHQGKIEDALRCYKLVRAEGSAYDKRAAYPLALALLQQGQDPANSDVWADLSDDKQIVLTEIDTFRRRPYTPSDDTPILWRAIASVDAGDHEKAQRLLEDALKQSSGPTERQWAHYYQGVLAAQQENWEAALRAWNAARAAGLQMERLEQNLQEASHRLAENLLEEEEVEDALLVGKEALRHGDSYPSLEELVSQAHQRLAHQAVTDGDWDKARTHWKAADAVEDGSFRLAYNLALAHERAENFIAAGERWREALRRRPRKDDHPDAITDDQVAQLWQRTAEAYTRAGEYDEAIQVYKNAVKWNPDRIEARLALSEALLLNDQPQAARNELNRILDRDPDNIHALLRMGEVVYTQGNWWWESPERYWERVLELDPDNTNARQLLVDFYQEQAENALYWNNTHRALELYHQALDYWPDNAQVMASLGNLYLRINDREEGQTYLERALEKGSQNLSVYGEVIRAWLDEREPEKAWRVMEQAEANLREIPYSFYVIQAAYCTERADDLMQPWLERAEEKAPAGEPVLVMIGEMLVESRALDLAREYLKRAIDADQEPGQAYLMLSTIAMQEGDNVKAETHLRQAAKIARQNDDAALMERIEMARMVLNTPPGLLDFLHRFGPEGLGGGPFPDFPDFPDEELDEWWW